MPQNVVGPNLARIRKEVGMTQAELAERLHLSVSSISKWERGRGLPDADQLRELCLGLKCSADEILGLSTYTGVEESAGIRWRVVKPETTLPGSVEQEQGIRLFRLLVKEGRNTKEVLHSDEFRGLNPHTLGIPLQSALFSGAVQILDVKQNTGLEQALHRQLPGLRHCIVADLAGLQSDTLIDSIIRAEAVAFLAARDCISSIKHAEAVGITGGSPISRFVDLIRPAAPELRGTHWIALLATERQIAPIGLSANSCVARMLYRQPGTTGSLLPYLNLDRRSEPYLRTASDAERHEVSQAKRLLGTAAHVDVGFVTVGTQRTDYDRLASHLASSALRDLFHDLPPAEQRRCVGDVLLHLLDADCEPVGDAAARQANEATVYSIDPADLKQIAANGSVWILASRHEKAKIIQALLKAGMANCLVIDNLIASEIMRG